jgi:mevalonate kinase
LLDSGIVGETAPMVNIFMENLKTRFPRCVKKPVCKYTGLVWKIFLANVKSLFYDTKNYQGSF